MKQLTKSEAKRAHDLREELKKIGVVTREHFFRTGEILREIRDEELWMTGYESFEAYYSDPELGFKTSTVYHAIKLVDKFPNWKKVLDIPISKLIMVAPHVTKENKSALVVASRALSRGDLRHELMSHGLEPEARKGIDIPKVYPCKTCRGIKGVRFDGLCHCGWTPEQIEHISKLIEKVEFGEDS